MADTHPVYPHGRLSCGKCGHALVSPLKKEAKHALIDAGQGVLMECVICSVAVVIPADMFKQPAHTHVETVVARPWPTVANG